MKITKVFIEESLISYLMERNLEKQYKKAKQFLLSGNFRNIDLKLREPKKDKIYYFRINKQFRAFAKLDGENLKIFHIDNHQK